MGSAAPAQGLVLLLVLLVFYALPTVIAVARRHKDMPAIAAVNILLGWSVVGWFVALIWSLADPNGRAATQSVVIQNVQHSPTNHPDQDVAFWDGMANKNDTDHLEEYLARFPSGRFHELAQSRLDRIRSTPTAPATE